MMFRRQTSDRRETAVPTRGLLIGMPDPAERRLSKRASNELKTNRQPGRVKPARNGDGRLPRRVEGHGEPGVGRTERFGSVDMVNDQAVSRHGDCGHGWRRERIEPVGGEETSDGITYDDTGTHSTEVVRRRDTPTDKKPRAEVRANQCLRVA